MQLIKQRAVIASLILIGAATAFVLFDYFRGNEPEPEGIIQATVHSDILGQDREILIHLPLNYDSTRSYPTAYVLDGSSLDGPMSETFRLLDSAGAAPPVIVVGIPNMTKENRERQLIPPFMRINSEQSDSPFGNGDKFLSFMEQELFPFIAARYRVEPVRLFLGHSRGGLLVMYSLLYRPEMFQGRFCYSTPFWRQENILISKTADFLQTNDTLRSFLFISVGENETENIKNGFHRMVTALNEQPATGFVLREKQTAGADHQNNAQISAASGIAAWGDFYRSGIK